MIETEFLQNSKIKWYWVILSNYILLLLSGPRNSKQKPLPGMKEQGGFPYSKVYGMDSSVDIGCLWEKAKYFSFPEQSGWFTWEDRDSCLGFGLPKEVQWEEQQRNASYIFPAM